jgi:outer membrane protease
MWSMGMTAMRRKVGLALSVAAMLAAVAPASAQDSFGKDWRYVSADKAVELRGGIGAIGIEAREHVFAGSGSTNNLSLLIWQSVAPMANVELEVHLPDQWTVRARATAALFGSSYMEDYDWFGPDFVSYNFDDWTHRSQHPNTRLDWYLDASLAVGRDVIVEPGARVNINGGLKYTDVQWTAIGGSYVYSDTTTDNPGNNFRAYPGTLPDDPAITYRQQLPVLFAGIDVEVTDGQWTYEAGGQAGVALFGLATDHHWMRTPPLRFIDYLMPAPMLGATATASYALSGGLDFFVSGSVEKVFLARGDTEVYNNTTGALSSASSDTAGAELGTISLAAGLKGSF